MLLLPAMVIAAAVGASVALVMDSARLAVGCCGAVATVRVLLTAAEAARRGRTIRDQRAEHARHTAYLERRIAGQDAEIVRLGTEIIPAAIRYLRASNTPREVMRDVIEGDPEWRQIPTSQRDVVWTILKIVDQ